MRHVVLAVLILVVAGSVVTSASAQRTVTFEDRVNAQEAIEQVYWNHRIWPKENPSTKPALSALMSDETIRAKVEDYLQKSNALEKLWQRPITPEQLQAEMARMAKYSRDPETLRELFAALGNDPSLIAETLARQTLVDRLIRSSYATDARFHGDLKSAAEAALAACATVDCMKTMGGEYDETTWRLRTNRSQEASGLDLDRSVTLDGDEWTNHLGRLAAELDAKGASLPVGRLSRLEEARDAFLVIAVRSQREGEVTTVRARWLKRSFDSWWSAERSAVGLTIRPTSAAFSLPHSPSATCVNDVWTPTHAEVPDARIRHTAVWTGTEMIIWGGSGDNQMANSGSRYNPTTDTWINTSIGPGVPAAREFHTAVWTGTEMIIWGGIDSSAFPTTPLNSGGRYNPSNDTWTATSSGLNTPIARSQQTAVWTGTEMIVWGGLNGSTLLDTGGRYNPSTDAWSATSTGTNRPAPRDLHTAVWTGTQMIIWGGNNGSYLNTGGRYDASSDTWTATSTAANVPAARKSHTAVWTGAEMIVWGGSDGADLNTGGHYDPSGDTWTGTSIAAPVPSARSSHTAVWTGTEMIVWGGGLYGTSTGGRYNPFAHRWTATSTQANVPTARALHTAVWTGTEMIVWGGRTTTGGRYNPSVDAWTPTSTGTNVASERGYHTATWTGMEMIVWGGVDDYGTLKTGARYLPSTDTWTAISTPVSVPSGRYWHTAVWTGVEMIVWGGVTLGTQSNVGGRYNPTADAWTAVSTADNVPDGRSLHTAVWTGTEMIVWGGGGGVNTGGRYNPSTDNWATTPTTGAPSGRGYHTAIWTGNEMIIWGGDSGTPVNTGGRYNPTTNTWTPTPTGANVPAARYYHTAVWTGTEMIVWGGTNFSSANFNTGGRYNPSTSAWAATSTGTNLPGGRQLHSAVWTGAEMIIWGGDTAFTTLNTGGRYNPTTDAWSLTSVAGVPAGREQHSAVWTGTEMIVWGGDPPTSSGGLYCACPDGRIYYRDADGDGFGDLGNPRPSCDGTVGAGVVDDHSDCNDNNAAVHPGEVELCNDLDDNCDGNVDNGGSVLCDDGIDCTIDVCSVGAGCNHTINTAACHYGNTCTADICDPSSGCVHRVANIDTSGFSTDRVDGRDLVVLADAWNSCPGDPAYDAAANLDQAGCVEATDFHLFMTAFGRACP